MYTVSTKLNSRRDPQGKVNMNLVDKVSSDRFRVVLICQSR